MIYHVTPINDIDEHAEETTCECKPEVEHINGNMVIIHNSFDGRENVEKLREAANNIN